MENANIAGLGSKIYLGVINEDGSMPPMDKMQEIDISGDRSLFDSGAEDNLMQKSFSATCSFEIKESDEEKERWQKEFGIIKDIDDQVIDYVRRTDEYIRQKKLHGRRRKAVLRNLLRDLCKMKRIVLSQDCIYIKIKTISDIEQAITNTRLKVGKATRCTVAFQYGELLIPIPVIGKIVKGKFTFKRINNY